MSNKCILFRKSLVEANEFEAASDKFGVVNFRNQVPNNSLVIGRYSVLPFYEELEEDLRYKNCKLINHLYQHEWISNFEYYSKLKNFTFKSYTHRQFHSAPEGRYIVKGTTNSKKEQWNTMMFAASKSDAIRIAYDLSKDGHLGHQDPIFREYIPLKTYEIGLNEQPFTEEYRCFYYKDKLLCCGYYWSQAEKAEIYNQSIPTDLIPFANKIASIASQYCNFYVLDIAKTESGEWILVEVNDGQMSGLSMCNPHQLYSNLRNELK